MPKQKVQSDRLRWPQESKTDWELRCPACQRTLGYQPIYVAEMRETKFTCLFCGKSGEAVWDRDGRNKLGGASK